MRRSSTIGVHGRTEVFGDIAQHFGSYAKAGVQDGTPFTGRGMNTLQFVRTPDGWRISAAAWDDERDGLTIDTDWLTNPQNNTVKAHRQPTAPGTICACPAGTGPP